MAAGKLTVEISDAKNLTAKDGQGTASAYVSVDFAGQRRRTKTVPRVLNPRWDEKLEFDVADPPADEPVVVNVYHDTCHPLRRHAAFLGRVRFAGDAFSRAAKEESISYYPLEKRSVFSQVNGELGLRISFEEKVKPVEPVKPVEEVKPVEPVEPVKPVEPVEPVKAAQPVSSPSKPYSLVVPTLCNKFDLVEHVPYFFLRILKVNIPTVDQRLYVKVNVGTLTAKSKVSETATWDRVFAFKKSGVDSTVADVTVWAEKAGEDGGDTCLGAVSLTLGEIPRRVPPESPLAPEWYKMGDEKGDVMMSAWEGTQGDESFADAWQSDAAAAATAYLAPRLSCLRLTVIEAQDLKGQQTGPVHVTGQLGQQVFRTTKTAMPPSPTWHEDLVFVAAEPFDQFLIVSVEESGKAAVPAAVGQAKIPLSSIQRRTADSADPPLQWVNLTTADADGGPAGRLQVRASLEAGYRILDEPVNAGKPLGKLEVGVRGAAKLGTGKDGNGDGGGAYVVLRYGTKWIRTRTVLDSVNPWWNEQYTWEIFDTCTVLTAAVFLKDNEFAGKVRVRLSMLDPNRVHVASIPLLSWPEKKSGELQLAVRFTCFSNVALWRSYVAPAMPHVHYTRPLAPPQRELLRHAAARATAQRLGRSEPPLPVDVVRHVVDEDSQAWSMRRSKANWLRLARCLAYVAGAARRAHALRTWENPRWTVLAHVLMLAALTFPGLILPVVFLCLFVGVARGYVARGDRLGGVDSVLSCVDAVGEDEIEEERDGFPTGQPEEKVKVRYDRLRVLAGRTQGMMGDVAALGERVEALLTWRDRRATMMFAVACLAGCLVFYLVPFRVVAMMAGCYYLRHPRFRDELPAAPVNFFWRLPSRADQIL